MDFEHCGDVTKNKTISVSENKMKFIIRNPNSQIVREVDVDGCLIDDHRSRCDYLFEISEPFTAVIYVELKGSDVEKAFLQLEATIGHCKKRHGLAHKQCHVVASRVPKAGTKIQNLKKRFVLRNKIPLKVSAKQAEVCI